MKPYLKIFIDDKIYIQRKPNSKISVFDSNYQKIESFEEIPPCVLDALNQMEDTKNNPKKYFRYKEEDCEITITGIKTPRKYMEIPEFINGMPVRTIGEFMIEDPLHSPLIQLKLPETIKKFSAHSFSDAANLKYINIPSLVTKIPYECFRSCGNMCEFDSVNIREIDDGAFAICEKLKHINLENIKAIGYSAFASCISLSTVNLQGEIKVISECAFAHCPQLSKVNLSDTIKSIKKLAFSRCIRLCDINFPKELEVIGMSAFFDCKSLTQFKTPSKLKLIENSAFRQAGLRNIEITENVEKIEAMAFWKNDDLENIILHNENTFSMEPFDIENIDKIKVITDETTHQNVRNITLSR